MTESRKQREIRAREELILDTAQSMVWELGYHGLTMDRIATAIEYSKGTVYQHFSSKEDLLVGLFVRACELRLELFSKAASYPGRPRERLTAIGVADELMFRAHRQLMAVEGIAKGMMVRQKASPDRQEQVAALERQVLEQMFGIFADALSAGELQLPPNLEVPDLCLALWAMHQGVHMLQQTDIPFGELGFNPLDRTLAHNAQLYLDGLGWAPLSSQHDYEAVRSDIRNRLFADECRACGWEIEA